MFSARRRRPLFCDRTVKTAARARTGLFVPEEGRPSPLRRWTAPACILFTGPDEMFQSGLYQPVGGLPVKTAN